MVDNLLYFCIMRDIEKQHIAGRFIALLKENAPSEGISGILSLGKEHIYKLTELYQVIQAKHKEIQDIQSNPQYAAFSHISPQVDLDNFICGVRENDYHLVIFGETLVELMFAYQAFNKELTDYFPELKTLHEILGISLGELIDFATDFYGSENFLEKIPA